MPLGSGRIVPDVSEPPPSTVLRGDAVFADALVAELLDARLVGVLSTYDSGGFIHSTPMWYARSGHEVVLATSARSRKLRNLRRDARATLALHDSRPGYEVCGASIAGTVEIVLPPHAQELVELVHARYLATEAASDADVLTYLESDDTALRFTPATAVTWDERASAAARIVREHGWALPLVSTEPRA
jgi:PPOX class probable F420-dependent enzyme